MRLNEKQGATQLIVVVAGTCMLFLSLFIGALMQGC